MKRSCFILVLILSFKSTFGQAPRELTATEIIQLKQEIEVQAKQLKTQLEKGDQYLSDFQRKIEIDFTMDTFVIEKLHEKKLEIDYSTIGMVEASYELLEAYDGLLNKYYKILISRLAPADQQILKNAQRSWVSFRDNEKNLIATLAAEEYSGGGTMQRIIVSSKVLSLTKERVFQLVEHLYLMMEE